MPKRTQKQKQLRLSITWLLCRFVRLSDQLPYQPCLSIHAKCSGQHPSSWALKKEPEKELWSLGHLGRCHLGSGVLKYKAAEINFCVRRRLELSIWQSETEQGFTWGSQLEPDRSSFSLSCVTIDYIGTGRREGGKWGKYRSNAGECCQYLAFQWELQAMVRIRAPRDLYEKTWSPGWWHRGSCRSSRYEA